MTEIRIEDDIRESPLEEEILEDARQRDSEEVDYMDQLKRLKADFDNYRRRSEMEKSKFKNHFEGKLLSKLLPFFDDLDRLLVSGSEDPGLSEGYRLAYESLQRKLSSLGLEKFAEIGDEFNPDRHEAVFARPTNPENVNKILSVLENGYIFKSEIIRPARVEVGVSSDN